MRGYLSAAPILAAGIIAAGLGGCSNIEVLSSVVVAPGKFEFYNCEQLAVRGRGTAARERELKVLMDKASEGAGGAIVNAVAYQGEYLIAKGELDQLEAAAIEKKCDTPWKPISARSVW